MGTNGSKKNREDVAETSTAVNRPISFTDVNGIGSSVDTNEPTAEAAKEEQESDFITSGLPDELKPTTSYEPKSGTGNLNVKEPEPETSLDSNADRDNASYEREILWEEDKVDFNVAFMKDTSEHKYETVDDTIISPQDGYVNSYAICTSALPLSFNSKGVFKRKVTREDEDNRNVPNCDISRKKENMILPNVIFFPDKSKGASPKRYGPKRLGKIQERCMSPEVTDIASEEESLSESSVDVERTGECNSVNISRTDSMLGNACDVGTNNNQSRCENNAPLTSSESCAESNDVTDDIHFAEDHFGLYTGSVATGISEHFKTTDKEEECKESATNASVTFLEQHAPNEYAHNVHSVLQHGVNRDENMHSSTYDTEDKTKVNISASLQRNQKKHKRNTYENGSRTYDDICVKPQDMDSEIIEICEDCRESRDICGCLLFGKVHVFQCTEMLRKPHLASFRYRRMFGKEIPWDRMISKQGQFAKHLSSVKTPIAHDNRFTYRFQLPVYNGLKLVSFDESAESIRTDAIDHIQMTYELGKCYANDINDNDLNSSDDCGETIEADRKIDDPSNVVDRISTSFHFNTGCIERQLEFKLKEIDVSNKSGLLESLFAESKTSDVAKPNGVVLDVEAFRSVSSKTMKCIPLRMKDDDQRSFSSGSLQISTERIQSEKDWGNHTRQPLTNGADLSARHSSAVNEKNNGELLNASNANSATVSEMSIESDCGFGNCHAIESKERKPTDNKGYRTIQIPCFSNGAVVFGGCVEKETSKEQYVNSETSELSGALNGAGNKQLNVDCLSNDGGGFCKGHAFESHERNTTENKEFRKIQIPCFSDDTVVFGKNCKEETSNGEDVKSEISGLIGALNGAGNKQRDADSVINDDKCSDKVISEQQFGNDMPEIQLQDTNETAYKANEDKFDLSREKVQDSNRESGRDADMPTDPAPTQFGPSSTPSLQVHTGNLKCDTKLDAIILKRTTPASADDNRLHVMKELENRAQEPVQKTNTVASTHSESRTSKHQGSNLLTGSTLGDTLRSMHERVLRDFGLPGIDLPFLRVPGSNRLQSGGDQDVGRGGEGISDFVRSFYEIGDREISIPSDSDSSINSSRSSSPVNAVIPEDISRNDLLSAMLSRETAGNETDSYGAVGGNLSQSDIKSSVETPASKTETTEIDISESQPPTPECIASGRFWQKFMQIQLQKCLQITDLPRSFRTTVLCVDASQHMEGEPWRQVVNNLHRYLECIASVKQEHQIEEYVALVVVGQTIEVKVHLTTDYRCVEKAIDTIDVGGPCLLIPALALSMYCLMSFKYRNADSAHDVTLENRIIVISSGQIDCHEFYAPTPLVEPKVVSDNKNNSMEAITGPPVERIEINLQECESDANSAFNTDVLWECPTTLCDPNTDVLRECPTLCDPVFNTDVLRKCPKTLCDPMQIILAKSSKGEFQNNSEGGCSLFSVQEKIVDSKNEALSVTEKVKEYGSVIEDPKVQESLGHGFVILPVCDRPAGEDELPSFIPNIASSISSWPWDECDTELHFVTIGKGPNKLCFDAMKSSFNTEKVIVQIHDEGVDQLARSTHNLHIVGQVTNQMFAAKKEFDPTLFAAIVKHLYPDRTEADLAEMLKVGERSFLQWVAQNAEEKEPWFSWRFEKSNLPAIGARLIVGPDLEEESKMVFSEKGTCARHTIAEDKVLVFWDNGCSSFHKIGADEKCEVLPVDTSRDCWPGLPIKLGYSVKRGPNWDYGNQDGGKENVGRVSYVFKDNTVIVRWPSGTNQLYRYRANGIQDVVIADPDDPYGTKEHMEKMNVRNTLDPDEKRWRFPKTVAQATGGSCEMNK